MDAQKYTEHIIFLGDNFVAGNYLPFAKKKANELYLTAKSLNINNYSKTFVIDDKVSIRISITNEHIIIIIEGKSTEVPTSFVNGISRYDEIVTNGSVNVKNLKEFIYKGSNSFINLPNHGIAPASFISTLGYTTENNTQHKFIKGSKYTGVMKHLIQNALSKNEQIGYEFGWEKTDGAIIQLVRTKKQSVDNMYNAEIFQDIIMSTVRISKDGVFINNGNYITQDGIIYDKNNVGFCGKSNATHIDNKHNQQYLKLDCILENSTFNETTAIKLLSATDMLPFYSKQGFFKSCGWLFLNNPYKTEVTNTGTDKYDIKSTHLMFNTCYDNTKSYLYAIELVVNGKYDKNNVNFYQASYTAKLHLVMEGKLSSLPTWLLGNSGLYMPNEQQNKVELFNKTYTENISDQFEFAPVFCVESKEDALSAFNLSDDFFYNQPINGYTGTDIPDNNDLYYVKVPKEKPTYTTSGCNIKVVGLMDIIKRNIVTEWVYENEQDQYPDLIAPVITKDYSTQIKNIIIQTHKNILTNNYTFNLPITFDGTNVDIFNYGGYVITTPQLIKNGKTYYSDGSVFVNSIGNWNKNDFFLKSIIKQTTTRTYTQEGTKKYETDLFIDKRSQDKFSEKIIIPMDDRNTIISVDTSSIYDLDRCSIHFNQRSNENYTISDAIYSYPTYSVNSSTYIASYSTKEYFFIYPGVYVPLSSLSGIPIVKYPIFDVSIGNNYFATKINNYIKSDTQYIGVSFIVDVYGQRFVYNVEDDINTYNYINEYPILSNYKGITFIGKP